jgi:hypothetical protein
MGDSKHSNSGVPLKPPTAEEVAEQLRRAQAVRQEAEGKIERAEATASEMSRILKRLASAIDRNPQSWDELLLDKGRHSQP